MKLGIETSRKDEVRKCYEEIATKYDLRYAGLVQDFYKYEEEIFVQNLPKKKNQVVLDIGAGTGRLLPKVIKREAFYIGVDLSKKIIEVAKSKFFDVKHSEFIVCDAEYLPFRQKSFDGILSLGTFEYINKPHKIIFQASRVLKEDGLFILNVWNKKSPWNIFYLNIKKLSAFRHASFPLSQIKNNIEEGNLNILKDSGYFFIPPSILKSIIEIIPPFLRTPIIKYLVTFDKHAGVNPVLKHIASNIFLVAQNIKRLEK